MPELNRSEPTTDTDYWLSQPIWKLGLRVRSRNGLNRAGIIYVHELVKLAETDIASIQHIGKSSVADIMNALDAVGLKLGMNVDLEKDPYNNKDTSTSTHESPPSHFRYISITQLGFSPRSRNCLGSASILNAFELVSKTRTELARIPNMGRKSLSEIDKVISALYLACDTEGNFSQENFVENSDFVYSLPNNYEENEPNDFIAALPLFFREFCYIIDERERYIAKNRIWPTNDKVSTLDEIGTIFNVSRERIRQIEVKVLNKLAGLLCEEMAIKDKQNKSIHVCDMNFSAKWIQAAHRFEGVSETDIHSFVTQLCDVWNVTMEALTPVLPLVIAVFTRSTTTELSRELRSNTPLSAPMSHASYKTRSTRLSSFRIGKHSRVLSETGINTINDLHKGWPQKETSSIKHIIEKLILAEQFLDSKGDLDWEKYSQCLGLKKASLPPPENPSQFFALLNEFLSENIPDLMTWSYCKDVFDIRTRFPANQRKTLKDCAAVILGNPSLGPSIARIEKYLLKKISNILIYRDYSESNIWIPQEFLDYVTECQELYNQSNGNYKLFCNHLCQHYSLSRSEVLNCSAVLWGMLDGLPPERYYHLSKRNTSTAPTTSPIGYKIKLAGFRTIH